MLTTTEFRSHWIDSTTGARVAQHRPYDGLTPVLNMDEVRGWLDLSHSDEMLRQGLPSTSRNGDAREFYVQQFLRPDLVETERERLAPLICEELTDDVPRYHQSYDRDWRTAFLANQAKWPAPPPGPATIVNMTPHEIRVGEFVIAPSGTLARAMEQASASSLIVVSIPDPTGAPADRLMYSVPTSVVRYTGTNLPSPRPGVYLVVSTITATAALSSGRFVGDLLVPGEPMRDSAGRIIGCRSLARVP